MGFYGGNFDMTKTIGYRFLLLCVLAIVESTTAAYAAREEIIVTTRKREENLQQVPVAVTALTEEQIEKFNINNIAEVTKFNASVIFDQGFAKQDTKIVMRGLAPTQGRQNVAILMDSIDITSQAIITNGGSFLINPRLFDLERVEVMRGTQNALYGRQAFAGAINYISRQPTEDFEARVFAEAASEQNLELKGHLSGPVIGDTLLGSVTAGFWTNDGFYTNANTGADIGGDDGYGVAGSLVWKPADNLQIKARLEYNDEEYEVDPYVALLPNGSYTVPQSAIDGDVISELVPTIPGVVGSLGDAGGLQATMSSDPRTGADYPGTERDAIRSTLTVDYDVSEAVTLTSLTHWARVQNENLIDGIREDDYATQPTAQEFRNNDETTLFSQELRVGFDNGGGLKGTIGGLYWTEELDFYTAGIVCLQVPVVFGPFNKPDPLPCGPTVASFTPADLAAVGDTWNRETDHWSVYGLVDFEVIENVNLVGELRYTDEEMTVDGPDRGADPDDGQPTRGGTIDLRPGPGPWGSTLLPAYGQISSTVKDDFWSPKITVQWSPVEGQMYYASWSIAEKPAGISSTASLAGFFPDTQKYQAEKMTLWELGGKTSWLDDRVVVNGAVFYQDFKDKQLSSQQQFGTLVVSTPVNAASAEVYGLELELSAQATDYLYLSASYTWLDTEYDEFRVVDSGSGNIAKAGNCTVVTVGTSPRPRCEIDLSGNELEYAADHTLVGFVEYRRPLRGELDWFIDANARYQDERWQRFYNTVKFDSYTNVDLRLGVANERFEIAAFVNNLFDDDTIKTAINNVRANGLQIVANPPSPFGVTNVLPPNVMVLLPDERLIGVRARFSFGS